MKKRHEDSTLEYTDRREFRMCRRKRKFKSNEASRIAARRNQRKYECPICGHWHLTKDKEVL